jgi:hypothetical protein
MRQIQQSLVSITIHTNAVQKLVNAHEVPILKAIHGDDDRCVVLEENAGFIESDISNEEELNRLHLQYGKYGIVVNQVFRNAKELGEILDDQQEAAPKPAKAPKAPKPAKAPKAPKPAKAPKPEKQVAQVEPEAAD